LDKHIVHSTSSADDLIDGTARFFVSRQQRRAIVQRCSPTLLLVLACGPGAHRSQQGTPAPPASLVRSDSSKHSQSGPIEPVLSADALLDWLQAHGVNDTRRFETATCRAVRLGAPLADGLICSQPVPRQSQWDSGSKHYKLWRYDGRTVSLVWSGHHTHPNIELVLDLARDGASFTLLERKFGGCKGMAEAAFQQLEVGSQQIFAVIEDVCFSRGRYIWDGHTYSRDREWPACQPADPFEECVLP
jgi:hypothetical protein